MYALESSLVGQPIVSLQTGQIVAWADQPILEISNLEVIAYDCRLPHHDNLMLTARDIRQYAVDCIIIDNEEELTEPDDIVRLTETYRSHYTPKGKLVVADTGRRLGTVDDYSINLDTHRLQRLFIKQALWRSWLGTNLIIDRTQIIDITPTRITVRDATVVDPLMSPDTLPEIHP